MLAAPQAVLAQDSDPAELRLEMEKLRAEMAALQARMDAMSESAAAQAAAAPVTAPVAAQASAKPQNAVKWRGAPEVSNVDGFSFKPRGRCNGMSPAAIRQRASARIAAADCAPNFAAFIWALMANCRAALAIAWKPILRTAFR
jgi:hypothetical protein